MKKLLSIIIVCLGCFGFLEAQNIWKPINIPGTLKGVAANGDLFIGEMGIQRSQDEGETWQIVLEGTYNGYDGFTISPNGRIFDLPYNQSHLCISDDGGDTWYNSPDFLYTHLENAPMYAVSDDTLFLYQAEGDTLLWTLDGGYTWDRTCLDFLDHDQSALGPWYGAMLADTAGNVYIGTWGWAPPESGVFQANLDNMDDWTLILSDSYVQSLVFDPEGNLVINCPAIANNGIFFSTQRIDGEHMVLVYSTDHGVNYTPIGEGLPSTQTVPETGLRLFKGGDQHLYCHGDVWSGGTITDVQYYKSFHLADEISIPLDGILTRVPAPYFESNASDNRLAIVTGEETYFTTVDGYWPNPDGDALIVGFDTIPIGSQIEVGGTYSLMEDDNGDSFKVFDIKRLAHPVYTSAIGYLSQFAIFAGPQYTYAWSVYDQKTLHGNYFLTVNGALQTELPILPDGTMLTDSVRYIVVGIADTIHDYYGNPINVLELTSVIPYEPSFTVNGLLSLQGDLCLSSPCGETAYLSLDEGTDRHYLTLVGEMRHNYINDSIFNEGVQAQINGLEATHYDLFGAPFQTLDILELEAAVEQTLVGPVVSTGNPNIGPFPPLGMELAFYHNGIEYYFSPYIEEIYYPLGGTNYQYILLYELDNDTLIVGKEVTAQFTTSTMRIDNYLRPNYRVTLNHAEYYEHLETLHGRLAIVEEPYNTMYAIITDDDERYLIEPYFVNYAEYDELVFGEDTIAVGDSFTATGEVFRYYDDYYEYFYFNGINILEINEIDAPFLIGNEWYYEIQNENGSITYQYMYQAGDTVVQDEPTHILVRINTLYDKDVHTDVTHEYVYERDGKLYWWNKTLEDFTVLYDFEAEVGDYWEIKVGTESLMMHVDAVEEIEYEGRTWRMLRVSDPEDLFSGNIVCGIGHLTSFFPERLMDNGDGVRVEGMRCYWVDDELVFKYGDEDCDAIYSDIHGVEEDGPLTGLEVYPNPTDGVLFVETHGRASLSNQTYRITTLMGQTLLTGQITAETQQIDVTGLAEGMYFITSAGETRKFVVKK